MDSSSKAALIVEVKALLDSSGSLVVRLARPVVDRTLSAAKSIMLEVGDLTTRYDQRHHSQHMRGMLQVPALRPCLWHLLQPSF